MSRAFIEGKALTAFPVRTQLTDYLAGLPAQLLSLDEDDGAFSAHVSAPGNCNFTFPGGRSLEIFVLQGQVVLEGRAIPAGQYLYMPHDHPRRAIAFSAGTRVFFATGEQESGGGPLLIVDPSDIPWEVRSRDCPTAKAGKSVNVVKHLRVDANGDNFGIDVMWPGAGLDCTEWHPVDDELFRLSGDLLVFDPSRGEAVIAPPGSYTWRPSDQKHLPKYSHTGCVQIFRNRTFPPGPCPVYYSACPQWPELLRQYQASFPIIRD